MRVAEVELLMPVLGEASFCFRRAAHASRAARAVARSAAAADGTGSKLCNRVRLSHPSPESHANSAGVVSMCTIGSGRACGGDGVTLTGGDQSTRGGAICGAPR